MLHTDVCSGRKCRKIRKIFLKKRILFLHTLSFILLNGHFIQLSTTTSLFTINHDSSIFQQNTDYSTLTTQYIFSNHTPTSTPTPKSFNDEVCTLFFFL